METNQVTWEVPPEYLAYEAALQQYNTVLPESNFFVLLIVRFDWESSSTTNFV